MIRVTRVRDVMTTKVITVTPETGLHDAVALLLEHRVSGLPVVNGAGELVGLLTEKDCLIAAHRSEYFGERGGTVGDSMTRELICIAPDADIMTALDLFRAHSFRRLPVTSEHKLVGLLSRRDVLRSLEASL